MKIGIMGLGFVGGALYKYFKSKKIRVYKYDKHKKIGSIGEVNQADVIFICVPTPYNLKNGFDISIVKEAVSSLIFGKIVIIKSSIIPGTTERLQRKYPKHKFLFNPEFLREVYAYKDMLNPERQIIGYTKVSRFMAQKIMAILPQAPFQKIMPVLDVEIVKYMANSFLAMRVVFANEFYDIAKKLGANYELIKEAVGYDLRIGHSHFNILHNDYRGYGGSCFPKDINAIIQLAESKKITVDLLKSMRSVNRKYLKQSGLTEAYFLKNLHKKKNEKK